MDKTFWINVPVKDMARAKAFYAAIGFEENGRHADNPAIGSFFLDKNKTVMMLFPVAEIEKYMSHPVTDTAQSNEILMNLGAATRAEVDEYAARAAAAGGTVFSKPAEAGPNGWMYICCFVDSEGHRWCVLHMDKAKAPKGQS